MNLAAAEQAFGIGVIVSAYLFGLRHGIDWDHLAAIADITSSQDDRRRSLWFGTLYALGHAAVVLVLGIVAIVAGEFVPAGFDVFMTRVVGATLIVLGVYVFYSLIKHGRDFRMRSRWMLVFAGVRRTARWVSERVGAGGRLSSAQASEVPIGSQGKAAATETSIAEAAADDVPASAWHHGHHGKLGHHHHTRPAEHDDIPNYGVGTSFAVGLIHGVGAETPTQVLVFLAAAGAGGPAVGIAVLVVFILGLLTTNSLITAGSTLGFLSASKNFAIYATVAVVTGVFSLFVGALFLLNAGDALPAFFGG
jgi:sulfite exporter TauE/SafE